MWVFVFRSIISDKVATRIESKKQSNSLNEPNSGQIPMVAYRYESDSKCCHMAFRLV